MIASSIGIRLAGGLALCCCLLAASAAQPTAQNQLHAATGTTMPSEPSASAALSGLPASIPLRRDSPMLAESANLWPWLTLLAVATLGSVAYGLHRRRQQRLTLGNAGKLPDSKMRHGFTGLWQQCFTSKPAADLEIVSSTRLTPAHSVHVLQWRDQTLLLGCAGQFIAVLATQATPTSSAAPETPSP